MNSKKKTIFFGSIRLVVRLCSACFSLCLASIIQYNVMITIWHTQRMTLTDVVSLSGMASPNTEHSLSTEISVRHSIRESWTRQADLPFTSIRAWVRRFGVPATAAASQKNPDEFDMRHCHCNFMSVRCLLLLHKVCFNRIMLALMPYRFRTWAPHPRPLLSVNERDY